jgi:hypothetical protein
MREQAFLAPAANNNSCADSLHTEFCFKVVGQDFSFLCLYKCCLLVQGLQDHPLLNLKMHFPVCVFSVFPVSSSAS